MAQFITVSDVRQRTGVDQTLIKQDSEIEPFLAPAEQRVEQYLNSVFQPKEIIEQVKGTDTDRVFLNNIPVLSVRDVRSGDNDKPVSNFYWDRGGKLYFKFNVDTDTREFSDNNKIKVRYIYGDVVEKARTKSNSDVSAGNSVLIPVNDVSIFSNNDWVEIQGMDGNKEVAQITNTTSNAIQVDEIVRDHESGSFVSRIGIHSLVYDLMNIVASLSLIGRIVGETFDVMTGYGLGDLNVQKGQPYVQWRETAVRLQEERDDILKRLKTNIIIRT